MSGGAPTTVFVVSHTHWDREWYRTFHQFRVDLVDVVRKVLDALEEGGEFRHFLLDGQAIILEDYLAVCPEDAHRIEKLVAGGVLSIGPWYVLPDEFLISAEAHVRNLAIGHKVAGTMGKVQKVGYMPDSFGHIAQMPQILRLAGIDSFVYTRGNGAEIDELGLEYLWSAPDGSTVLAINQCGGYCNGGALGLSNSNDAAAGREVDPARAVEQIRDLFSKIAERSRGDIYLVSNGCDHEPPQRELASILGALREAFPATEFKHAALQDYIRAVRDAGFATGEYTGELVSGRLHHVLSGVWSSRMYLKQRNDRALSALAEYLEPIAAYCHFLFGRTYPAGQIEYAWKLVLQNHPHDSICGCSIDEVHRDMMPRFDGVQQTAEQIVRNHFQFLVPRRARKREGDRNVVIGVLNPLPETRSEVVERLVVLPSTSNVHALQLMDEEGCSVPFTVLERWDLRQVWEGRVDGHADLFGDRQLEAWFDQLAESGDGEVARASGRGGEGGGEQVDCVAKIQFVAEELPALGHANFRLQERSDRATSDSAAAALPGAVTVTGNCMENDFCRITLHPNGAFDLLDKKTGTHYEGLNRLEDTADIGDEYDYAPCAGTKTLTSDGVAGQLRVVDATGFRGRLEARFVLSLPASIDRARNKRTREMVGCPVTCRLVMNRNSPVVEVELRIDNRAKDHRLRVAFPTPIETDTIVSDGHFFVNHRSADQPGGPHWKQQPVGTFPQRDFSLLQDGARGLAVVNRGLPEVATFLTESGGRGKGRGRGRGLAVTLLRAVGWLSRGDFSTRDFTSVGPLIPTPDAQCIGEHRFEYAVVPFGGDYLAADIKGLSRRYRVPVLSVQGVEDQLVPGGRSFLRKETNRTCISAIKKHDTRDTLIVRLFNLTASAVDEVLYLARDVRNSWRVNGLEERERTLACRGSRVSLTLNPYEIVTVEVEYDE